jgi:hypothetical protein
MPLTWTALAEAVAPGAGVVVVVVVVDDGATGNGPVGAITPANAAVTGRDSMGVSARTSVARRTVLFIDRPFSRSS